MSTPRSSVPGVPLAIEVLVDDGWRSGHLVCVAHRDGTGTWWHVTYLPPDGAARTDTVPLGRLRLTT